MSFSAVGLVFDRQGLREHLAKVKPTWAKGVTIHHTAEPSLAQRPKGFTIQHMRNIQYGYEHERGWDRGPHLFTDEDQIFGLSPLSEKGIHAVAFNSKFIGIEALGNYDSETPKSGRGYQVMDTTAMATAVILAHLKLQPGPDTVKFHRDDPSTSKTCPGNLVEYEWFLFKVRKHYMNEIDPSDPPPASNNLFFLFGTLFAPLFKRKPMV